MAAAVGGSLAAFFVFLGAFTYGVVYTIWLKRRSVWNIVIGGAAGSFAILAGAAAVDPALQPVPVILAIVMFLWTPPHFWSLAAAKGEDYRRAGVPMLPIVVPEHAWTAAILAHAVVLAILSLVPLRLWHGAGIRPLRRGGRRAVPCSAKLAAASGAIRTARRRCGISALRWYSSAS